MMLSEEFVAGRVFEGDARRAEQERELARRIRERRAEGAGREPEGAVREAEGAGREAESVKRAERRPQSGAERTPEHASRGAHRHPAATHEEVGQRIAPVLEPARGPVGQPLDEALAESQRELAHAGR